MIEQGQEAWAEARRGGIGGSEVAALYPKQGSKTGTHHPWLSPYKLWAIKTGRLTESRPHPLEAPALWWGSALEPIVREAYQIITGRVVKTGATLLRHPQLSCMVANTDGEIEAIDDRGPGVYEGKSTTLWSRDEWQDGRVPLYYQAQAQHYMGCTGLKWSSVAVYIAGERQPILHRDIDRNEAFIDRMMERIDRWWTRHVVNDEPPDPDGSETTSATIAELFPEPNGEIVQMGEAWVALDVRLSEITSQLSALDTEKTEIKNKIMAALGSAEFGALPDGSGWSFKKTTRKGYTKVVKPTTFRQLRRVRSIEKATSK